MRIDKYPVLGIMVALAFQACNDDYVDQFDINVSLAEPTSSSIELSSSDYSSIASNEVNKALALSLDPETGTYASALAEVGSNGYFNGLISAADFIPAFLDAKYFDSELGTKVTVKYRTYSSPSAYLADFSNFTSYTLASKDYGTGYSSLNPNTEKNIPAIIKSAVSAEAGQKVMVNYKYSDVTADPVNPTYKKVTEFDGAGNYVIAALNADGKYVTFGKLEKESYSYGYCKGAELEATDDVLSDASDYAIAVEESASGFTLQNSWGQYLFMKGTYNSFNVQTSLPESGADWAISPNGDGTFSIKNVSNGKSILFSNSYGNFGAYSATTYVSESMLSDTYPDGFLVQNTSLADGLTSVWSTSAKYGPKATAYVNKTNYAAESWLVSSEVDLSKATKPFVSFDWASRFFANSATEALSVLVSDDYVNDVKTANWTALTIQNVPDGSNWNYVNSGSLDLSAFKGKKVRIAFKYTSTSEKAATVELKNFTVAESMDGYSECYLFKEVASANKALVLDYNKTAIYAYDGSSWAEYNNPNVNIDVMQPSTYMSIGSANVESGYLPTYLTVNHPFAQAGDVVAVAYNNVTPILAEYTYDGAIWEASKNYVVEEITFTKDVDGFNANLSSYMEETLTGGNDGGFSAQNVSLSGSLTYVWSCTSAYGWKASAYASSKNNEAEAWLVTPSVNFKKAVAPYLTFDEAHKFLNGDPLESHFQILATANYTGDVTTSEWTDLTSAATSWSDGTSWDFCNIGQIDLSAFIGKTDVVFAFKYVSTSTVAPTFEVKNFIVKEKQSEL